MPPTFLTCEKCQTTAHSWDPVADGWTTDVGYEGEIYWLCPECSEKKREAIEFRRAIDKLDLAGFVFKALAGPKGGT